MATLWERVRALEGQALRTVTGRGFDVAAVGTDSVRVIVHSSGRTYPIPRREFDQAEALGLAIPDVKPSQLREAGASEFHPAYVAAIIRAVVRPPLP